MELDLQNWTLQPGTLAVGRLIAGYPDRFGRSLLTTNFGSEREFVEVMN
jgi:hypothetical protein